MSCGCSSYYRSPAGVDEDEPIRPTYIMPEETIECYMARAEGTPVPEDPEPVNKIATLNIPVDCEMKVNTTFKMTEGSDLPVTWNLVIMDENADQISPDTLGLTWDDQSGKLEGTVKPEYEKKVFTARVKAIKDGQDVDEKTYKFVPKKCEPSDLRFINPNPSGVMTSKFGPRRSPTAGASSNHKGVDLSSGGKANIIASADGVVTDYTGFHSGYGNVVEIEHRDASGKVLATTRYAHLRQIYVTPGMQIAAGEPVGKEGNTGVGTGPHLHFEIRLGGYKPVDPMQYINGQIVIDADNDVNPDPGTPSGNTTEVNNQAKAMTREEVEAKTVCPEFSNHGKDPTYKNSPGGKSPDAQYFHKSQCRPAEGGKPSKDEVIARMNSVLDKHPELDQADRDYMKSTMKIESSYDPYAAAGTTSALGPFQMVNKTAVHYYNKIGVEPTCENRCNVEYATEAQIAKYKDDLRVYDEYQRKGTILGRVPPQNAHTATYSTMTKGEFMYTQHHDGVGSMQKGRDLQGAGYWKTHSPTA